MTLAELCDWQGVEVDVAGWVACQARRCHHTTAGSSTRAACVSNLLLGRQVGGGLPPCSPQEAQHSGRNHKCINT
jgi:hypothetical protein